MKEDIAIKAKEMFIETGFKSITMDDIAHEMCISKKTIYQHYPNKNCLIEESTKLILQEVSEGIDKICCSGLKAIEEKFAVRNYILELMSKNKSAPFFQLKKFYPKIALCLMNDQFIKMQYCVKKNLEKGIAEGVYRPDINVEFISRIYYTGMSGIKDMDIFPLEIFDRKNTTKDFLEYHLRAIVTPAGLEQLKQYI